MQAKVSWSQNATQSHEQEDEDEGQDPHMSANRFKMLVQIVHPPSPQISPQSLPASKVHDGIAATSEAHPSLSKKKTIFLPQINIHLIEAAFVSKMGFRNFDNMENQDAILLENISNKCKVYGIFDGHGQHGKMMSRTAKSVFQSFFKKYSQRFKKILPTHQIQTIVKKTLEKTNTYLLHYKVGQAQFSGTTALLLLLTFDKVFVFNIGNSRAVLAKMYYSRHGEHYTVSNISSLEEESINNGGSLPSDIFEQLKPFQLTKDQSIDRFDERLRIVQNGGVIAQYKDRYGEPLGPQRIWVKGEAYPGIFITRALGLSCSYNIGVICQPEVSIIEYNPSYKFIILASDGFWDVISNQQAVSFLETSKNKGLAKCLATLVDMATKRWKKITQLMDDISIIVVPLV